MPERVRDLHALGVHIVSECRHVGARVRLLGGVAVLVKCQRVLAEHCGLRRCPDDIDVAARQGDIRKLSSVLARIGFHEDAALPGPVRRTRRVYRREADRIKLDIYLDRFRMCHSFPFDGRLDLDDVTLPVTDLLLTKLQVLRPQARDLQDAAAIILTAAEAEQTGDFVDTLDFEHIADLCSRSWGWHRSCSHSLGWMRAQFPRVLDGQWVKAASSIMAQLESAIRARPRSLSWRVRSILGDLVPWYEVPRSHSEFQ